MKRALRRSARWRIPCSLVRSCGAVVGVAVALWTAGCASTAFMQTDDLPGYQASPSPAEHVEIYASLDAGRDYVPVGAVVARVQGDMEKTMQKLREAAAELGADAVVDLETTYGSEQFGSNSFSVSGTAVKFK